MDGLAPSAAGGVAAWGDGRGGSAASSSSAPPAAPTPTVRLTELLHATYKRCNPAFVYLSSRNPRRILTKPSARVGNNGHDNAQANLILCVNDELDGRFVVEEMLGQGTFGQVVLCSEAGTGRKSAVKVIKNKPAYYNQALMEISILEGLNSEHDPANEHHLVRLYEHFVHKRHLCLVFELLSVNLYELIKQNHFRGLSCNLIRTFAHQLLDAMSVIRRAGIIHCDLKPENVLLEKLTNAHVKLIDFGSACTEGHTVYSYIQSRFYRSPEVLLGLPYDGAIDMWSLGCITAELFLGLPLFPGASQYDQVSRIVALVGVPDEEMLLRGKKASKFFSVRGAGRSALKTPAVFAAESGTAIAPSKRYFRGNTLEELVNDYPLRRSLTEHERRKELESRATLLHFLRGLLQLDPRERWTPDEAREHPFITAEPASALPPFEEWLAAGRRGGGGGGGGGRAAPHEDESSAAPPAAAAAAVAPPPPGPRAVPLRASGSGSSSGSGSGSGSGGGGGANEHDGSGGDAAAPVAFMSPPKFAASPVDKHPTPVAFSAALSPCRRPGNPGGLPALASLGGGGADAQAPARRGSIGDKPGVGAAAAGQGPGEAAVAGIGGVFRGIAAAFGVGGAASERRRRSSTGSTDDGPGGNAAEDAAVFAMDMGTAANGGGTAFAI